MGELASVVGFGVGIPFVMAMVSFFCVFSLVNLIVLLSMSYLA